MQCLTKCGCYSFILGKIESNRAKNYQVKRHVDLPDDMEAPGGNSREVPDLGNGSVDELEEAVLVAS